MHSELVGDPSLRLVQIEEGRGVRIVDTPEASFQELPACLVLVLVRQMHQNRDEEAIRKHQLAFGVIASGRNLYGLKVKAHAAARSPRCR